MLTPRGWMLLFLDFLLLAVATYAYQSTLAVTCLALLAWLLGEWLVFLIRAGLTRRGLTVWRQVRDERGPVDSLWAGWNYEVEVELRGASRVGVSYARLSDWLPFTLGKVQGDVEAEGPLAEGRSLRLNYRVRCRAAGEVRFEGVGVQFLKSKRFSSTGG